MDLEQLLQLSLIEIKDEKEREKMLSDLEKILDYFSNLREVDTENINPNYTGHSTDYSEDLIVGQILTKGESLTYTESLAYTRLKKGEYLKGPKIL